MPLCLMRCRNNCKKTRNGRESHNEELAICLQGLIVCRCCGYAYYGKAHQSQCAQRPSSFLCVLSLYWLRCLSLWRRAHCVGTNNCERIWLMKPSGRKSVGSSNIPSGWSRSIGDGFCKRMLEANCSGLEGQIGRLRQGLSRLIDSYADGIIEKMEFEPRIARMRERLKQMEEQAQQLKDEASLEQELRLILGRLKTLSPKSKRDFIWLIGPLVVKLFVRWSNG